jgi:dihydroxyacetone kinase-like predicted kinase
VVAAEVMDGAVVRRWCRLAAEALGQTRSAIDALNVYPVPDADTGTNLYRTLRSAAEAVDRLPGGAGPAEVWRSAADGAMLGACGNSGIIVSQLLRGLAEVCGSAEPCDGRVVASALGHAAKLARAAVSRPAEGTVLTVADAAARAAAARAALAGAALAGAALVGSALAGAEAAGSAAAGAAAGTAAAGTVNAIGPAGPQLGAVVLAAASAARSALGRTTGQLPALAARGVVDAGAAGLCVVLDALVAAVSGTSPDRFAVPVPGVLVPGVPVPGVPVGQAVAPELASYGYEVTYLIEAPGGRLAELREQLDSMGDSLVIAGGPGPSSTGSSSTGSSSTGSSSTGSSSTGPSSKGPSSKGLSSTGLWSVHVHVPEAGAAIEAGLRAGRLRRITVTYLGAPQSAGHQVLAICDTAGMAALAESAGARALRSSLGVSLSADELSAVIRQLARRCIIVPNGAAAWIAATAAAAAVADEGIEVRIVDVRSPVQALPALAVHEPRAEFEADAAAMDRAAARMRTAQQSAARQTAGQQTAGQQTAAALALVDDLLVGGAELMTFLIGAAAPAGLAGLVMARVREVSPATEIECHAVAPEGIILLAGAE